ncbi:MAG: radical SAM protein [Candidatus Riflebacteria bacterium]|nr:radical SAM protein [Candidatus Riflebacteria bacterium]
MSDTSGVFLRIFRREPVTKVLGPGKRAVIWVQGCKRDCPGCIAPEGRDFSGGKLFSVNELSDWVSSISDICGLTISGGEPMEQSAELCILIDRIREIFRSQTVSHQKKQFEVTDSEPFASEDYSDENGFDFVCFTGFKYEELLASGSPSQKELLNKIDLLIDGTYIEEQHGNLLWRGSSNQRLIPLSEKFRKLVSGLTPEKDISAGLEVAIENDGKILITGVPHSTRFRENFEAGLKKHGITLQNIEEEQQ